MGFSDKKHTYLQWNGNNNNDDGDDDDEFVIETYTVLGVLSDLIGFVLFVFFFSLCNSTKEDFNYYWDCLYTYNYFCLFPFCLLRFLFHLELCHCVADGLCPHLQSSCVVVWVLLFFQLRRKNHCPKSIGILGSDVSRTGWTDGHCNLAVCLGDTLAKDVDSRRRREGDDVAVCGRCSMFLGPIAGQCGVDVDAIALSKDTQYLDVKKNKNTKKIIA